MTPPAKTETMKPACVEDTSCSMSITFICEAASAKGTLHNTVLVRMIQKAAIAGDCAVVCAAMALATICTDSRLLLTRKKPDRDTTRQRREHSDRNVARSPTCDVHVLGEQRTADCADEPLARTRTTPAPSPALQ